MGSVTPFPAPSAPIDIEALSRERVQITPEIRGLSENVRALAHRIERTFSGPFNSAPADSMDAAQWQARELADAANALDRAIRRARR